MRLLLAPARDMQPKRSADRLDYDKVPSRAPSRCHFGGSPEGTCPLNCPSPSDLRPLLCDFGSSFAIVPRRCCPANSRRPALDGVLRTGTQNASAIPPQLAQNGTKFQ